MHARIRKNDTVMVVAGRERGKTGKVMRVYAEKERATVERLNMVKRHTKARGPQTPYGIVEKEAPIHLSNLMMMCDKCNAPVRIGKRRLEDGRSVRVCRRCGEQLDR
jgi:large subunit ribosomal protein L24